MALPLRLLYIVGFLKRFHVSKNVNVIDAGWMSLHMILSSSALLLFPITHIRCQGILQRFWRQAWMGRCTQLFTIYHSFLSFTIFRWFSLRSFYLTFLWSLISCIWHPLVTLEKVSQKDLNIPSVIVLKVSLHIPFKNHRFPLRCPQALRLQKLLFQKCAIPKYLMANFSHCF